MYWSKIFMILLVLGSFTSSGYGQILSSLNDGKNSTQGQENPASAAPGQAAPEVKAAPGPAATANPAAAFFTGTVGSVSDGSAISGTQRSITVTDDNGRGMSFNVADSASILDSDGKPISLDWVEDHKVSVGYTSSQDGNNTAQSIKMLPE